MADLRESGGGAAGGEGGLALVAVALVPDPQACAVVALVAGKPFMIDGAVAAHALQGDAHPGEQSGFGEALEAGEGVLGAVAERPPGEADQSARAAPGDVHGEGAGGFQGASVSGLEAHFEGSVEQEPTAHVLLGGAAPTGGGVRVPVGLETLVLGEGGGDEPVAVEGAAVCGGEGGVDPGVDGHVGGEGAAQGRAQTHGVRALVDESGPVGGVLDGIGEDEGAFVGLVEGVVAEEGGESDGQEGCDGGAEEADRVPGAAGGADVVGSVLGDGSFVPGEGEDGQDAALLRLQVGVLRRMCQ